MIEAHHFAFTNGLVDTPMHSRLDMAAYYLSLTKARNVQGCNLGGMKRREGMAFVATLSTSGGGAVRIIPFVFNEREAYVVVFQDRRIDIFDAVDHRHVVRNMRSPYRGADLSEIDFAQSLDVMILVHPKHRPQKLERYGSEKFRFTAITLKSPPSGHTSLYSFAKHGNPAHVALAEGRTIFAASADYPATFWASRTSEPFDFTIKSGDDYSMVDTDPIMQTLSGDRMQSITAIIISQRLMLFTKAEVFASNDLPLTPRTGFAPATFEAACPIRPVPLEGAIAYLSRGAGGTRQALFELTWDNTGRTWKATPINILCPSIISKPVDMAMRRSDAEQAAHHVFILNGDGTLAVLASRREQEVTCWTRMDTQGTIQAVCVAEGRVFFAVRRRIGGRDRLFLETLDDNAFTDASRRITGASPATSHSGFSHLNGQDVHVLADGNYHGIQRVTRGTVTLSAPAANVEAGLGFPWEIEPPAPQPLVQRGVSTLTSRPHCIHEATLALEDTAHCKVDGIEAVGRQLGRDVLGRPLPRFTGRKRVCLFADYSRDSVRLSGHLPLPATVLSMHLKVSYPGVRG